MPRSGQELTQEGRPLEGKCRDRWFLAYWIVLLQGLASALPWNVFITETEYFNLRARQSPFLPILAYNFEGINLLTSMGGQMLGYLVYLPLHHVMSLDLQVLWPQILTLAIMIFSIVLTLQQQLSGNSFMTAILSSQIILNVVNATIVGGVYELTSWLPAVYLQGMSLGIGIAGTAVSAISFVTLAAVPRQQGEPSPAEVAPAAFAYFTGSAVIVALSIVTYLVYFRLPYVHSFSIPEVLAQWVGSEESPSRVSEPKVLRRESANFLRSKTRDTSSDVLSSSISRSLNSLESPLLTHYASHIAGRSAPSADEECPLETSWSGDVASGEERPTSGAPSDEESSEGRDVASPSRHTDYSHPFGGPFECSRSAEATASKDLGSGIGSHAPVIVMPLAVPSLDRSMDCPIRVREHAMRHSLEESTSFGSQHLDTSTGPAKSGQEEEPDLPLAEVIKRLWVPNLVVGLGCTVTMATFPGVTSAVCSQFNEATVAPCRPTTNAGRFFGDLFVPFMFLVCNGSDLIGRLVAGAGAWSSKPPSSLTLMTYTLLRIPVSIPLLFCNIVTPKPWRLPLVFRSDFWPVGIAFLLGFSNGHLQSLSLMHAPSALPKSARYRVGPIINFALAVGTTLGSVVSFFLIYILQS